MRPSEDELIATLFAPLAGPGGLGLRDDAALITPSPGLDLVVTKDMLVAGVHFFAGDPPDAIARKALRVNLSDLAAKGAKPIGFCLGIGLPSDWTGDWLAAFATGLSDDTLRFGCPLLGGDTVKMPGPLTVSITAFGEVPSGRMVPRTGARTGDLVYVSGTIGDAALGLRLRLDGREDAAWIATLDDAHAAHFRERYLLPKPRLGLRHALQAYARAAMDVSDGLVGDLAKMLRLEGLSAIVEVDAIPQSDAARAATGLSPLLLETTLTGGDDYEILCLVPPEKAAAFEADARQAAIAVSRIGVVVDDDREPQFLGGNGAALAFATTRFSHF
jgi:thiamine-monophosphate kinase